MLTLRTKNILNRFTNVIRTTYDNIYETKNNIIMNMQIKVNRVAQEIMPKLHSVCDWHLADISLDGDEFAAIHTELMHRVISKIYDQLNKTK
jgi:hypothetical protein